MVVDVSVFGTPEDAAKTLLHEVGHWIDYMDNKTLKRGNVIGRLLSLHKFMKENLGNLDNQQLRDELIPLSEYWRPWDRTKADKSFIKYRDSAVELYADALSVLLNNPKLLEDRAPNFYREFFANLESKPQVGGELVKLWETLDQDYTSLVEQRINDSLEEYAKADEIIKQKAEEARERRKHWKRWWDWATFALNYRHSKFEQKLVDAKSNDYNPPIETDPRVMVEEALWFAENNNVRFIERVTEAINEAADFGVEQDVLGKMDGARAYLGDRSVLANPAGIDPMTAKEQLTVLRKKLGPKAVGILRHSVLPKIHGLFFDIARKAVENGIINVQTFKMTIEPNKDTYAPFAVMKYLEAYMPATVKRQIGTFEAIGNPLTALIMKGVAMHNFIGVQKAKRTVIDHLKAYHGGDIQPAATKKLLNPAIKKARVIQ